MEIENTNAGNQISVQQTSLDNIANGKIADIPSADVPSKLSDIVFTIDLLKSTIASIQSKVEQCNCAVSYLEQAVDKLICDEEAAAQAAAEAAAEAQKTEISIEKKIVISSGENTDSVKKLKKYVLSGDMDDYFLKNLMLSDYDDILSVHDKSDIADSSEDTCDNQSVETPAEEPAERDIPAVAEEPVSEEGECAEVQETAQPEDQVQFDTVQDNPVEYTAENTSDDSFEEQSFETPIEDKIQSVVDDIFAVQVGDDVPSEPVEELTFEAVSENDFQPVVEESPDAEIPAEPSAELTFETVADDNILPVIDEVSAAEAEEIPVEPVSIDEPADFISDTANELIFETAAEADLPPVEIPVEISSEPSAELTFETVADDNIQPVIDNTFANEVEDVPTETAVADEPADMVSDTINELVFETAAETDVQAAVEDTPSVEDVVESPAEINEEPAAENIELPVSDTQPIESSVSEDVKLTDDRWKDFFPATADEPVTAAVADENVQSSPEVQMSSKHDEWLREVEQIKKSRADFVEEKLQQELKPLIEIAERKRDDTIRATQEKLVDLEQVYKVACEVLPTISSINIFKKKRLTEEMEKANENMKYFKSLIFKTENEYYADEENAKRQVENRRSYYESVAEEEYPIPQEPVE